MLSDWHIGTGSGGHGQIDRSIARDENQLPYIPAKTLTGLVRDACEEMLDWLGHDSDPEMYNWATYLFGRANQPSRVRIRSARMDSATQEYMQSLSSIDQQVISKNLATVKAGVSIDAQTGRAKDDHLSFTEVARPMELTAEIELLDVTPQALALFASACETVEYVGGKRRRGLGRCRIRFLDESGKRLLTYGALRSVGQVLSNLGQPPVEDTAATAITRTIGQSDSVSLELTLTAQSPLLFPISRKGNVVTSSDYIPGSALLPLVHEVVQSAGFDAQQLIREGRIVVGRGMPVFAGRRTLPVPFTLSTPKGDKQQFINNTLDPENDVITKQVRSGWVSTNSDGSVVLHHVAHVSRTHNSISDDEQRPTADVGGVFTYEAIAAGQQFVSTIQLPQEVADVLFSAQNNETSLPVSGAIGSSRKDDYGHVSLYWDQQPSRSETNETNEKRLVLWCTSDVIINSLPGRGIADAITQTISQQFSLSAQDISVDLKATRLRPSRVEAWQSRWGLPRTSLFGIAAGSCIALSIGNAERASEVASAIQKHGMGVRRAEGFGSVVVNHPLLNTVSGTLQNSVAASESLGSANVPSSPTMQATIGASIRDAIRRKATEVARQQTQELPAWWSPSRGGVTDGQNHQFAILRRYAMNTSSPLTDDDKEQFDHDLDAWDSNSRKAAWSLLSTPSTAWETLGDFTHPLGTGISDVPETLVHVLWVDAVRTLVESVHRRRTRSVR